jgi:hypothetical protein
MTFVMPTCILNWDRMKRLWRTLCSVRVVTVKTTVSNTSIFSLERIFQRGEEKHVGKMKPKKKKI